MNTTIIVWVMVVYTHAGNWVPTIEFKDQQKCTVASLKIQSEINANPKWGRMLAAKCIRIEK
jgi:hypothetical protein